jgi:hypothetical protein
MKLILILILCWAQILYGAPPIGIGSQSTGAINYSNNTIVPYRQSTKLTGVNTLIETGNENLLVNSNFEGSNVAGVAIGWTNSAGTPTITTTSSEITSVCFNSRRDSKARYYRTYL